MSSIRFICQHCHQPMKLSQSAETWGLDPSQQPEASERPSTRAASGETWEEGPLPRVERDTEKLEDDAPRRSLTCESREFSCSSKVFTLLGKLGSGRTLSSIQKAMRGLCDILSGAEDPDYPLCEHCTDNLLEQLDTQLAISEADNGNYQRCLETAGRVSEDARERLWEALEDAELEEARLVLQLQEVETRRERAAGALRAAQAQALDQQERQHQRRCRELQWQQLELQDELRSLENRLRAAQTQLDWLENTNAFRATFAIDHEGPLASIRNFRLGCLPSVPVGWKEINAAWGQTALLLLALSKTVGLEFQRFRLFPCGQHSYLRSLAEDAVELPLFCNGGPGNCRHNAFDKAMMAFLDCLQQFKEEAEKGSLGVHMPHRIHVQRGLIEERGAGGGLWSIRTHRNTEEQWTKALKLMLINFNHILAWVSLRYCQK